MVRGKQARKEVEEMKAENKDWRLEMDDYR